MDSSEPLIAQSPSAVLTLQPKGFYPNEETLATNKFQSQPIGTPEEVADRAITDHTGFRAAMLENGVDVIGLQGTGHPDEIFLNNWFSTHDDIGDKDNPRSVAVIYPMLNLSRQEEVREDIVGAFKEHFGEDNVIDLRPYGEPDAQGKNTKALEGTGSMVLDRQHKIIYAALSERTNEELLNMLAEKLGYKTVTFNTEYDNKPIYHTNVMMWVGTKVAGICLDSIPEAQRPAVRYSLESTGHEILEITPEQMTSFAGNAFELTNKQGEPLLVMSDRAYESLRDDQRVVLRQYYPEEPEHILHPSFVTPECAGGSTRCATAALHTNRGMENLLSSLREHAGAAIIPDNNTTVAQGTMEYIGTVRASGPLSDVMEQVEPHKPNQARGG